MLVMQRLTIVRHADLTELIQLFRQSMTQRTFQSQPIDQGLCLLDRLRIDVLSLKQFTKTTLNLVFGEHGSSPRKKETPKFKRQLIFRSDDILTAGCRGCNSSWRTPLLT